MRKIHVLTQKEVVREEKLAGCTAVVIDVFLATTTIAFLLENKYEAVHAMKSGEAALDLSRQLEGEFLLFGETGGEAIDGFHYPDPCLIQPAEAGTAAIICSTNGTIAIEKARSAKKVYISSLVNGHRIARSIHELDDDSSIVLICSGNADRFSMEDFIGAGQVIHHLLAAGAYELSDGAKMALDAYRSASKSEFEALHSCETANLLHSLDFSQSVDFVLDHVEKLEVVPVLEAKGIRDETKKMQIKGEAR